MALPLPQPVQLQTAEQSVGGSGKSGAPRDIGLKHLSPPTSPLYLVTLVKVTESRDRTSFAKVGTLAELAETPRRHPHVTDVEREGGWWIRKDHSRHSAELVGHRLCLSTTVVKLLGD